MASDLNKPISTDLYADVLTYVRDNFAALVKGLDPAVVTPANIPTNAVRWNSVNKYWEKYNGSTWAALESSYGISISGSAATWTIGRTITFTGAATGVSGAFNGSANISIALTQTTVPVNKGGTNLTSYTVGDLLYASGATTLAKRAAVATGSALISGGVGAAPSWGKIGLTTHISGTLAIGNGGTGATTAAAARTALGVDAALPSGTRMLFQQTSAPTGWTKDTTAGLDNSALRLVTGTAGSGGSQAFTTAFAGLVAGSVGSGGASATGATTLTTAEMPAHTHGYESSSTSGGTGLFRSTYNAAITANSVSTGGGGSHTHTTPDHAHTFTGSTNLAVKYVDLIVATKA